MIKAAIKSPTLMYENNVKDQGYTLIAGVDEAGRAPLAGPVVAAAVILPKDVKRQQFAGVKDSKQLTHEARERLYQKIIKHAHAYAVAQATAKEIDTLNIHHASLLAMKRAVEKLGICPEYVLVDGRFMLDVQCPGEAIVNGDQKSLSIGAASILAKVVRDRIMTALDNKDPRYGWRHHKGYPTPYHRAAVQIFGASPEHRTTFAGVKEYLICPDLSTAFQSCFEKLSLINDETLLDDYANEITQAHLNKIEKQYLSKCIEYRLEQIKQQQRQLEPSTTDKGKKWENFATAYMECKGYSVWERNYKVQGGELDLVCNRGNQIIFVEVKSRSNTNYGHPAESITPKKKNAIIQTAERYLYDRSLTQGWDIRYDLISILKQRGKQPEIEHIEDAFRMEESFA